MTDKYGRGADPSGEEGFSLIETIAALALFSLLAGAVLLGLRTSLDAWRLAGPRLARLTDSIASRDLIRRMITQAYPLYRNDAGDETKLIEFSGTKERLVFLTQGPEALGNAGRYHVELGLGGVGSRKNLDIVFEPELAAEPRKRMGKSVLVENIKSIEFYYFGPTSSERNEQWQGEWLKRAEMPRLVRLHVSFHSGDHRDWEDLMVSPKIAADVTCSYDPITRRCRGR